MKKAAAGYVAGFLSAAVVFGGVAYATVGTKTIEAVYSNIKVYKDNVLCELKDANGTVIEPFIYNGTTYLPVRGAANLADMHVTWDGASKSVYLWDEMVPEGTSFMEVCPPYSGNEYTVYNSIDGDSFTMAGEKYSDGMTFCNRGYALFNLNSKYDTIECTIGHTRYDNRDQTVSFIVDGKTVKTVELEAECLPKQVSIPVKYGLQLKIVVNGSNLVAHTIGIGNMTVR